MFKPEEQEIVNERNITSFLEIHKTYIDEKLI